MLFFLANNSYTPRPFPFPTSRTAYVHLVWCEPTAIRPPFPPPSLAPPMYTFFGSKNLLQHRLQSFYTSTAIPRSFISLPSIFPFPFMFPIHFPSPAPLAYTLFRSKNLLRHRPHRLFPFQIDGSTRTFYFPPFHLSFPFHFLFLSPFLSSFLVPSPAPPTYTCFCFENDLLPHRLHSFGFKQSTALF